jgi:hypothetical protein
MDKVLQPSGTVHRVGGQSSPVKLKKLDLVVQDEVGWRITDSIFCKWLVK